MLTDQEIQITLAHLRALILQLRTVPKNYSASQRMLALTEADALEKVAAHLVLLVAG